MSGSEIWGFLELEERNWIKYMDCYEVDTLHMISQVFNLLFSSLYPFPSPSRVNQGKRAAVVATALAGKCTPRSPDLPSMHGARSPAGSTHERQLAAGGRQTPAQCAGGPIWIPFDAPGTLCHVWQTNINIVCRNRDRKVSLPQRHGLCQFRVWVAIRTWV